LEQTIDLDSVQIYPVESSFNDTLQFIANQTYLLINTGYEPFGLKEINQFYITKLQQKGLANHNGKIHWKEVISAFNHFYGEKLLKELQSYIPFDKESTWLHKLLRKPRVTCHPLRHILIIGFLDETIESMASKIIGRNMNYDPFGKGVWPCLNKAADHYKAPVISFCNISRCSKTGFPVGTFNCSCGYVYSRKG